MGHFQKLISDKYKTQKVLVKLKHWRLVIIVRNQN